MSGFVSLATTSSKGKLNSVRTIQLVRYKESLRCSPLLESTMALQASPQPVQSTIPPDAFAVDAPSSRRHYAQRSPQLQDDQHIAGSPQPSRRRPSGGNISQPATPQHRTPNTSHTSSASTARALPTTQPSPRTPTAATSSSQYTRREPQRDLTGPPISPPPRTSSNQRGTPVTSHQEMQVADRTRYRDPIQYGYPGDEDRNIQDVGSTPRSRRDAPLPTNNAVDSRTQPSPASSQHRNGSSSQSRLADMSREGSEVLNRVVVTDPEVDITREQERLAEAIPSGGHARSASMPPVNNDDDSNRVTQRTRQDFSSSASRRKETKFGEYILGQTLGEGEFGKVKLGWKKDGSVQVAIKLIRRENLTANPTRLPKIYREVTILGSLSHPNIVRLHEMVETERYIGIILEYASGGELFDYILTHRYLKDNAARRLFAQLVSGVGYLHKKGIVHRDLKLENLLLDRNRNIIITDFGFANNFDPKDELGEEIEYNLINKDFVKKMDLERIRNGVRRGDLMQTSCGSPCYAAPELVVTDSLYTGRKVDVWSCGVILVSLDMFYSAFSYFQANLI